MFHKCWHDTLNWHTGKQKASRQQRVGVSGRGGGHGAVGCAERVEATDGEGIHCVLCDLNYLFCFLCPSLALIHSLQQAFHSPNRRVDIMLWFASIQTPAHTLLFVYLSLIMIASPDCLSKFWQIDVMNVFAQGRSGAVYLSDPDNCSTYLILMVEFHLHIKQCLFF